VKGPKEVKGLTELNIKHGGRKLAVKQISLAPIRNLTCSHFQSDGATVECNRPALVRSPDQSVSNSMFWGRSSVRLARALAVNLRKKPFNQSRQRS